ncbi:MAG TPA: hypothetical protein V6D29_03210, partial [Leptolyngbyaceae cyanobacterium]
QPSDLSQADSAPVVEATPLPTTKTPSTKTLSTKTQSAKTQNALIHAPQLHATAPVQLAKTPKQAGFRLQHGLVLTGLVATLVGLGGGLVLRLQSPAASDGTSRLSPEQSFPPLPDWRGNDPVAEFDTPYVPNDPTVRERSQIPHHAPSAPEPIETPFRPAPVPYGEPSSGFKKPAPEAGASDSDAEVNPEESSTAAPDQPSQAEPTQPDVDSAPPAPAAVPPAAPAPDPAPAPAPAAVPPPLSAPAPAPAAAPPAAPTPNLSRPPSPTTSAVMTGAP